MVDIIEILSKYLTPTLKRSLLVSFIFSIFCSLFDLLAVTSLLPFIAFLNNSDLNSTEIRVLNFLPKVFNENQSFYTTGLLFGVSVFIASIVKIGYFKYNSLLTARIGNHLSNLLFSGYLSKEYEYHVNQNPSKFIAVITAQLDTTVKSISLLLQLLLALITFSFLISFLITLNPKFTILTLSFLFIFYFIIIFKFRKKIGSYGETVRVLRQDQITTARETIGGIRDIIINQNNDYYTNNFKKINVEFRRRIANTEFIGLFPKTALEGTVITILVIGLLILHRSGINTTLAELGGAAYAAQKLLPTMQMIYFTWTSIKSNEAKIAEVRDCLNDYQALNVKRPNTEKIDFKDFKTIELSNISYKYKTRNEFTLKDCNIKINEVKQLALGQQEAVNQP